MTRNSLPLETAHTDGTHWSEAPVERGPIPGRKETFGLVANVNLEGVYLSFPETRFGRGKAEVTFKALGFLREGGPIEIGKKV